MSTSSATWPRHWPATDERGREPAVLERHRFAAHSWRPSLALLVDHDDEEREFAYRAGAEQSLEAAQAHG
jgi:hypothetical protein